MTPVIHCSTGTITLFPRTTFTRRREIHPPRCSVSEKYRRQFSSFKRLLLPQPSPQLFHIYKSHRCLNHSSRIQIISAVGTDVTIDEQNSTVTDKDAEEPSETQQKPLEVNETVPETPAATSSAAASSKSKRPRSVRKSEMPPVKNEELVTGATFTGKVRSVQPFGAFIDFGAFTDGLVHVSRMSDGYVKDVGSLVSVGQEVKVRIVEANMESGRISLTMRDGDDYTKPQRKEAQSGGNNEKQKTARRNASRSTQKRDAVQKTTNLVKGQVLDGTVKNMTRSGAFISLPDGEEGFLPVSEESEGFGSILGNSSLQVGQEVNVRVLRVSRGQVTLTMKKEEDVDKLNMQLNQGVVHVATNPFELAFRRNKDISAFLDEQERIKQSSKDLNLSRTSEQIEVKSEEIGKETESLEVESLRTDSNENQISVSSASGLELEGEKIISGEQQEVTAMEDSTSPELVSKNDGTVSASPQVSISVPETLASKQESSVSLAGSDSDSVPGDVKDEEHVITSAENAKLDENSPASVGSPSDLMSGKAFIDKEASNSAIDIAEEAPVFEGSESSADDSSSHLVKDQVSIASEGTETGIAINSTEETVEVSSTETSSVDEASLTVQIKEADSEIGTIKGEDSSSAKTTISATDSVTSEASVVVNGSNFTSEPSEEVKDPISAEGAVPEKIVTSQLDGASTDDRVENEVVSYKSKDVKLEVPEASNGQTGIPAQVSETKATISPALVKQLREETGAGMMDCKKALAETAGDLVKAQEFLRKKGLASADKKASRATAEGRIGSYIHDNRIGVLIEVNCETDFVSRGEIFKELVGDLAMQVAACPQVRYLAIEDVPEEIVNKEREIEMEKEDLLSKPEQIRSKIVDGRIRKRLEEFALLEQPYIKNDKIVVKDWVKQTIATVGENIKVKRFTRYNLGEGLEKKNQDFAAEVAAQTAGNPSSAVPKDQSAETKEPIPKPPTTVVSAALVKQLREETGAGMMDCKRALSETGGDLEKAQDYLRKKGLSSAEKKSSRLAAEGRISSYIHDSRIGCLIEVNCETDFVGRNERFKELVDDLAMQVVACPQVGFVSIEDIPESIVNSEKEIEMQREDLQSKPENIREKIVAGRVSKRLGEFALLEQPFIKNDSILVKDLVKQTIAALGENIRVRRFVRFTLGENKN